MAGLKKLITTHQEFKRSIAFDRWCRLHGRVTRFHFCKDKYPELFVPGYDDGVVAMPQVVNDEARFWREAQERLSRNAGDDPGAVVREREARGGILRGVAQDGEQPGAAGARGLGGPRTGQAHGGPGAEQQAVHPGQDPGRGISVDGGSIAQTENPVLKAQGHLEAGSLRKDEE